MRIEIDHDMLERELNSKLIEIGEDIRQKVEAPFTIDIISRAAPIIETFLKSAASLPSRGSLKQFYDTQSDIEKKNKGWRIPKNTTDPHLIEMWEVDWEMSKRDDVGKVIITNLKKVKGREAIFDLFELLWNGTETYVSPVKLSQEEIARLTRQRTSKGVPLINLHSREKERWLFLVHKYKKVRTRGKKRKVFFGKDKLVAEGEVEGGRREKTPSDMWAERLEQFDMPEIYGKDSKFDYVSEPARYGSTDYEKRALEKAGLTASGVKRQARKDYIMQRPPASIESRYTKGKKKYIGRHGARFPHLTWELYDIAGNKPGYYQTIAHYMHFYNRFKGAFYINQLVRRGIEGQVLADFHEYVSRCILNGINVATGMVSEETVEDIYRESRFTT